MKENHRVESLKAFSQSARHKRIRRFESSAHTETRSLPAAAAPDAGTERVDVQPEKHSEFGAPKPTLIASRMGSVGRRREPNSGEERPKPFKRGLEGRPNYVRNLQSQRPIAPTRQPNKQQGLGNGAKIRRS